MSAKTPKKQTEPSIFVIRERLALAYTLRPLSDDQKAVLSAERIHSWQKVVEFKDSEEARNVLTDLDLSWSHKK